MTYQNKTKNPSEDWLYLWKPHTAIVYHLPVRRHTDGPIAEQFVRRDNAISPLSWPAVYEWTSTLWITRSSPAYTFAALSFRWLLRSLRNKGSAGSAGVECVYAEWTQAWWLLCAVAWLLHLVITMGKKSKVEDPNYGAGKAKALRLRIMDELGYNIGHSISLSSVCRCLSVSPSLPFSLFPVSRLFSF